MSRGSKYSAEEKLNIVEACLSGAIGVREAGRRVGADGKTIGRWISRYKAEGSSAFMPAERNRIYPVELKQQVVEEYLTGASNPSSSGIPTTTPWFLTPLTRQWQPILTPILCSTATEGSSIQTGLSTQSWNGQV